MSGRTTLDHMFRKRRQSVSQATEPLEVRALLTQFVEIDGLGATGLDSQGALLGSSVAMTESFAVLGAPKGLGTSTRSGQVAIYERDDAGTSDDISDDFWTLHSRIPSPIDTPEQNFGAAVAIEGRTIVIGAPGNETVGVAGRVFVFDSHGEGWSQIAELTGPTSHGNESFGASVAIEDETILVGSPLSSAVAVGAGVVDVYELDTAWSHNVRLFGSNPTAGDGFGTSVAVRGNRLAIGVPRDDVQTSNDGSVAIYQRSNNSWEIETIVTSTAPTFGGQFGHSVSLLGKDLLVGAPFESVNDIRKAGAAYAFTLGDAWRSPARLVADTPTGKASFGTAVSLGENRALVGAPNVGEGRVTAFSNKSGPGWRSEGPMPAGGRAGDRFGQSITQSGAFSIVGVPSFDVVAAETGSAKSYAFSDGWAPTRASRLRVPSEIGAFGANYDGAGSAVATDGNTLVVGVPGRDKHRRSNVGQVLVLERDDRGTASPADDEWTEVAILTPPRAAQDGYFGSTVAVAGNTIVVGAPGDDAARADTGAAYVFERNASWQLVQTLAPSVLRKGDAFGSSLSLVDGRLAIGAPDDDAFGYKETGSAYLFQHNGAKWRVAAHLYSQAPEEAARFGLSVSLNGDIVAVGAPHSTGTTAADSGTVEVFKNSDGVWNSAATITPTEGRQGDRFGESVVLDDDDLWVGSPGRDSDIIDSGAVFRWQERNSAWALEAEVRPSQPVTRGNYGYAQSADAGLVAIGSWYSDTVEVLAQDDAGLNLKHTLRADSPGGFGRSVSISGDTLLVGNPLNSDTAVHSGLAHVFLEVPPPVVTIADAEASEDSGKMAFTVSRSHNRGEVRLHLASTSGTAIEGTDFVGLDNTNFSFTNLGKHDRTISVSILDDPLVESDESFRLEVLDSVFADADTAAGVGTILEDDIPAVALRQSGDNTTVSESGRSDVVFVKLKTQPQNDVTLGITFDNNEARSSAQRLVFTNENWSVEQPVTIVANDDFVDDGDLTSVLTVSVLPSQSDERFQQLRPQSVRVAVIDNDTARIVVSQSGGSTVVSENNGRDRFTIRLGTEPTAPVVVGVASRNEDEAIVDVSRIEFDQLNWSEPQSVVVTGIDDSLVDGTQRVNILITIAPDTSAREYTNVKRRTVRASNLDHELDFGFAAKASYPTAISDNGARHLISSGLRLGTAVTNETNSTTREDEANDGVTFDGDFEPGGKVVVSFEPSDSGFLSAWIDLNQDGDWDDFGEQFVRDREVTAGRTTKDLRLPMFIDAGRSFVRVRLSTQAGLSSTGLAPDGEVEDYPADFASRPRAVNDSFEVTGKAISLDVLGNDVASDPLKLVSVTKSDSAAVSVAANKVHFDANTGFAGELELKYKATGAISALTDRMGQNNEYGRSIAIDGDIAVVGLPGLKDEAGAIDVFSRSRSGWVFEKRLVPATRGAGHRFGEEVAISGGTIAVGAPGHGAGVVSMFEFRASSWVRTATVSASGQSNKAAFGTSLSLSGNQLAVGAPFAVRDGSPVGEVVIYERQRATAWTETTRVSATEPKSNDQFGASVHLSQAQLVVGAPKEDTRGNASGAAYIFEATADGWEERQRLSPKSLVAGDHFGFKVTSSDNVIAISAPLDDSALLNSGAVWLFKWNQDTGTYQKHSKVRPKTPHERARFGESVAIDQNQLVVGSASPAAPVVVFQERASGWAQSRVLSHGTAVGISHSMILFGAPGSSQLKRLSGAIFAVNTKEFVGKLFVRVS